MIAAVSAAACTGNPQPGKAVVFELSLLEEKYGREGEERQGLGCSKAAAATGTLAYL